MKERKSFMLYTDCGSTLKLLTNEEIGEVIRAVFALVQEEEIPEISSRTAEVFFSMLKTTLERDFEKYQAVCERNRENGRRGGRPRGARPSQFEDVPSSNCKRPEVGSAQPKDKGASSCERPRGARPTQFEDETSSNCKRPHETEAARFEEETSSSRKRPYETESTQFGDEMSSNCERPEVGSTQLGGEETSNCKRPQKMSSARLEEQEAPDCKTEAVPLEREMENKKSLCHAEAFGPETEAECWEWLLGEEPEPGEENAGAKTQKNPEKPKKADKDSDSDSDKDNDRDKDSDKDTEREKKKEKRTKAPQAAPFPPPAPQGGGFSLFWESYPRKAAKAAARREWEKLSPSPELTGTILRAVETAKGWESWKREEGRYIPNPATWLREERWEDKPPQGKTHTYDSYLSQWGDMGPLFDLPEDL